MSALPAAAREVPTWSVRYHENLAAKKAYDRLEQRALELGCTALELRVLTVLWKHTSQQGGCYPSQLTIAQLVPCCERAVRNALKRLERLGLIIRVRTGRGRGHVTVYKIPLADVEPRRQEAPRGAPTVTRLPAARPEPPPVPSPSEDRPPTAVDPPMATPESPTENRHDTPVENRHDAPTNKEPEFRTLARAPARERSQPRRAEGIDARAERGRLPPIRRREREGVGFEPAPQTARPPSSPTAPPDPARVLALAATIRPGPDNPKGPTELAKVIARAELLHQRHRGGGGRGGAR
jgi:biotin operon repressor